MKAVSTYLGNPPAVARSSYVDPRLSTSSTTASPSTPR